MTSNSYQILSKYAFEFMMRLLIYIYIYYISLYSLLLYAFLFVLFVVAATANIKRDSEIDD